MKAIAKNFVLSLVALLITLLLLELGWRWYWSQPGRRYNPDRRAAARTETVWMPASIPGLLYRNRPDYRKGKVRITERHGIIRSTDVAIPKPESTLRVAVVGDSIAAAMNLREKYRFSSVLEGLLDDHLKATTMQAEVLNLGVSGYGTLQEAIFFEYLAEDLAPDIVVLQYCMNDPGTSITPGSWFEDPPVFYLLEALRERVLQRMYYAPLEAPSYETVDYWYSLYEPGSKSWESVAEGFSRIDEVAAARGAPVLLVAFPFLVDDVDQLASGKELLGRVKVLADRHAWQTLDLSETYGQHPLERIQLSPGDIYHPNPFGQRLAAQAIYGEIVGLVDSLAVSRKIAPAPAVPRLSGEEPAR